MSSDKKTASKIAEIEIEDPLNFLSAEEMDIYFHAREQVQEDADEAPAEEVPACLPFEGAQDPKDPGSAPAVALRPGDAGLHEQRQVSAEPAEEVYKVGRRETEDAPAVAVRTLDVPVKIGALIIVLLVFSIVWLLFLKDAVYGVFGWNDWEVVQEENVQEIYVITTSQLNLRNGPSTETGEIVVTVPQGTRLAQIAEANGWSTVLYEGQTLYCSSEYLKAAE
ncbi:MAG: SH3 domain-containing protein [Lachnospiraceae bacterium]|nr:SH3 domain-containing protein [Lachnospiraceae bacterium]